jgi:hypothetical protein
MRLSITAVVLAIVLGVLLATPAPAFLTGGKAVGNAAATLGEVQPASHCRCLDKDCRRIECRQPVIMGVPPGATNCQCTSNFFLFCTRQQCASTTRSATH